MVRRIIGSEEGYTLVEILVSLAILSVVLSLASATFLFVSGRMVAWSDQITFYNNFQIINDQLYNDLVRAKSISHTDTTLTIYFGGNNNQRDYAWTNGTITINEDEIFTPQDSVWIHISERLEEEQVIEYVLLAKSQTREMRDSAIISVRKPALWESINSQE